MAPLFVLFPSPFLAVYFAWDFTTAGRRACRLVGFTAAFFFASSVLMATYSSTWYCSYIILYRPSFNLQQQQEREYFDSFFLWQGAFLSVGAVNFQHLVRRAIIEAAIPPIIGLSRYTLNFLGFTKYIASWVIEVHAKSLLNPALCVK